MTRCAAVLAALALLATGCGVGGDDPTVALPTPTSSSTASPSAPSPTPSVAARPSPAAAPTAATPQAPAAPKPPVLAWKGCGADGFQCAKLPVPLVAGRPDKGTVTLALTRKRSPRSSTRIGSLIVNPGGPGASAVDYLQAAWQGIPADVRARFDLVAFDPRGVGATTPVRCGTTAELDRYFALDPDPDDEAELAELEAGNDSFVAGCTRRSAKVLPTVSTLNAALDLDAVRAAVGDPKLSYLGYSYGTSIGAAYLDRFPTRVRAMVLDGALDPTLTWDRLLAGQSAGFDRALKAFLADCEKTRCAFRDAVEGDLGEAYDRLAAQVDRTPLPTGERRSVGPGEFSLGVGAGLYSRASGWPAIADGLAAAEEGDGSILLSLNDSYLDRGEDGYRNVIEANFAVNCIDRPWSQNRADHLALADEVRRTSPRFGPAIALSGLACMDWPVAPVSTPHAISGAGSPKIVVIGTTGDPATPFAWSQALASQLQGGVLLTNRGDGHTVYRAGAKTCITGPVNRYLLTGQAPSARTC